jgi:SPW repeat
MDKEVHITPRRWLMSTFSWEPAVALLALAGLYSLVGVSGPPAWTATAFAVLVFVSPWAFSFTGKGAAAWTAWIAGGLAAIVGLWAANQARHAS